MIQISIFDALKDLGESTDEIDEGYLGPKSDFVGYSAYIKSYAWRKKRLVAIEKNGKKCQGCGRLDKPLEVHHLHYRTLYNERLEDVRVLCSLCHENADRKRESNNMERAYDNAFVTWASKKYGEECWLYMDEMMLMEEFDEWLEWKENNDW